MVGLANDQIARCVLGDVLGPKHGLHSKVAACKAASLEGQLATLLL